MTRWIRSPILFASALLLPVLLLWLALAPHRAPVTGEDGAAPAQSTAPVQTSTPSATPPPGWQPVDLEHFGLYLPPGWRYEERQGIDSFVGAFVSDDVELIFDYGMYSNSLPEAGDAGYEVTRETIGGKEAKIVRVREAPARITGVTFRRVAAGSSWNCTPSNYNHLTVEGGDLTADQQLMAVAIFRTIRFPGPGDWTVIDAPSLPDERTTFLYDVQMLGADDGWAVGVQQRAGGQRSGAVLRFRDGTWSAESNPATRTLSAVDMTAEGVGWAVGDGTAMRYDGTDWTLVDGVPDRPMTDVLSSPDGDAWIAAGTSVIRLSGFPPARTDIDVPARILDRPAGGALWAAGGGGGASDGPSVHRSRGAQWSRMDWPIDEGADVLAMDMALEAPFHRGWIGGSVPDDDGVVGWLQSRCQAGAEVVHYTSRASLPAAVRDIEMVDVEGLQGWAVGGRADRDGYIAHIDGGDWTVASRPLDGSIHGISMFAEDGGWAVGARRTAEGGLQGVLLRYGGPRPALPSAPSPSETPTPDSPTATDTPDARTATPTPSVTATADPCDLNPPPTPVPLWVDPVTSPTRSLTQTVTVYLGFGREVTVDSVAGSRTVTGTFNTSSQPARVTVPLRPGTRHHLQVSGRVEYHPGCFYTLTTDRDRNGDPLIIDQVSPRPVYLPALRRSTVP